MSARGIGMVLASAVITTFANLLMRAGLQRAGGFRLALDTMGPASLAVLSQPLFTLGVLLYGIAAVVWFGVISMENLSTAYPLLVSLTFVLVTSGAVLAFRETVSVKKISGIFIILAGVWVVARA